MAPYKHDKRRTHELKLAVYRTHALTQRRPFGLIGPINHAKKGLIPLLTFLQDHLVFSQYAVKHCQQSPFPDPDDLKFAVQLMRDADIQLRAYNSFADGIKRRLAVVTALLKRARQKKEKIFLQAMGNTAFGALPDDVLLRSVYAILQPSVKEIRALSQIKPSYCGEPGGRLHSSVQGSLCTDCWELRTVAEEYRNALVEACYVLGALKEEKNLQPPSKGVDDLIERALLLLEEAGNLLDEEEQGCDL